MCVECLIGKQKNPILFEVTEPSSIRGVLFFIFKITNGRDHLPRVIYPKKGNLPVLLVSIFFFEFWVIYQYYWSRSSSIALAALRFEPTPYTPPPHALLHQCSSVDIGVDKVAIRQHAADVLQRLRGYALASTNIQPTPTIVE